MNQGKTERGDTSGSSPDYTCHCNEVLIADDDAFNLIALEGILNMKNILVDKVFNGPDALNKLREEN